MTAACSDWSVQVSWSRTRDTQDENRKWARLCGRCRGAKFPPELRPRVGWWRWWWWRWCHTEGWVRGTVGWTLGAGIARQTQGSGPSRPAPAHTLCRCRTTSGGGCPVSGSRTPAARAASSCDICGKGERKKDRRTVRKRAGLK